MTSLTDELEALQRRLKSLAASGAAQDRAGAERALASYLSAHRLARRPVRWASDAREATRLVAVAPDAGSAYDELIDAHVRLDTLLREKGGKSTEEQWRGAPEVALGAGFERFWGRVRQLVIGPDVILSVPWMIYEPRHTPDRGLRVSRDGVWYLAQNLIELLSSSARGFIWWRTANPLQRAVSKLRLRIMRDLLDAFEAGLWQFWATPVEIIALPRPALLFDEDEWLHSEDGPAVSWPGSDQCYYHLNGIHVPEEVAMTPADRLDPRLMLFEPNAEVRREIIRKVGIERVCEALGARCIDRSGDYELLLLDLRDGRVRPFLKMRNPSVPGVYHVEGVHPNCRTVAEALAWRNQSDIPPTVLT
ncbi:MAG: hypothetical protein JOZ02_23230 [Acidobacteria bacterium]|nr:hypothetical protein [Acidobacteriota bacterium]